MSHFPGPGGISGNLNSPSPIANRILKNKAECVERLRSLSIHAFGFVTEAASISPSFSPSGSIKGACLGAQVTDTVGRASC